MRFSKAQIERSIRNNTLSLDRSDKIRYFTGGAFRVAMLLVFLAILFTIVSSAVVNIWFIWSVTALLFGLSILGISIIKFRDLRLSKAETGYSEKRLRELVVALAELKKWKISNNRKSLMILKTGPGRTGTNGWGERITLLIDDAGVWISSISDPGRSMSWKSYSRNKRNIGLMKDLLSGRVLPATSGETENVPSKDNKRKAPLRSRGQARRL